MGNIFEYAENELENYSCSCPSVEKTNKKNIESAIQAMRDYARAETDVSNVISIMGIIERLYIKKPLSPITDEDFTETCGWSEYRFQTSRFPMMIKKVDENTGEVIYSDISRVSTVIDNWNNFGGKM